jgi:hypothetical protein
LPPNPELFKLASLSAVLAMPRRGADVRTAQLATDMAMSVFRLAFERWVTDQRRGSAPYYPDQDKPGVYCIVPATGRAINWPAITMAIFSAQLYYVELKRRAD